MQFHVGPRDQSEERLGQQHTKRKHVRLFCHGAVKEKEQETGDGRRGVGGERWNRRRGVDRVSTLEEHKEDKGTAHKGTAHQGTAHHGTYEAACVMTLPVPVSFRC